MDMRINLCLFVAVLVLSILFYFIYFKMELHPQEIENIMHELEIYNNDKEVNRCAKLLFDTNQKVTIRSFEIYDSCISEIKRIRAEQKLRKMIEAEH